ncbi:MAG: hypothetical protein WCG27_13065, partial [Pseudomonadota bacterium]
MRAFISLAIIFIGIVSCREGGWDYGAIGCKAPGLFVQRISYEKGILTLWQEDRVYRRFENVKYLGARNVNGLMTKSYKANSTLNSEILQIDIGQKGSTLEEISCKISNEIITAHSADQYSWSWKCSA